MELGSNSSKKTLRVDTFISEEITREAQSIIQTVLRSYDSKEKLDIMSQFLSGTDDGSEAPLLLKLLMEGLHTGEKTTVKIDMSLPTIEVNDPDTLLTSLETQELTNVKAINTVKNWVKRNKMIGFTDGGRLQVPGWQIVHGKLNPHISTFLKRLNQNGALVHMATITPCELIDGVAAYELILDGKIDKAMKAVNYLLPENMRAE